VQTTLRSEALSCRRDIDDGAMSGTQRDSVAQDFFAIYYVTLIADV